MSGTITYHNVSNVIVSHDRSAEVFSEFDFF